MRPLPTLRDRASGVLLHLTSLPGPHGSGDLGPYARAFAASLARGGQRWWQMLPVHPPSGGPSPYQASSTFAGNPFLISLSDLEAEGLLAPSDFAPEVSFDVSRSDWSRVEPFREHALRSAEARFRAQPLHPLRPIFDAFTAEQAWWLDDFALYAALKNAHGGRPWTTWDAPIRIRAEKAIASARHTLRDEIQTAKFIQFCFFRQWGAFRRACAAQGVGLIGDVPIFVGHDSADVWTHQDQFFLDAAGEPTVVAGVPPDAFSDTGQRWGNPLYRWDVMQSRGYGWWRARIAHTMRLFDAVRLDHFIGFSRYWEIPANEPTAVRGVFRPGPGRALFDAIRQEQGDLPFIAEDLGVLTDEVRALRDALDFPGMRVLQFSFGTDAGARDYHPHTFPKRSVVYTGTHDNDTIVGWLRDPHAASDARARSERDFAMRYAASDGKAPHWDFIRLALMSAADTAIVPLTDVLGLGSEARMNKPAVAEGNWSWRIPEAGVPEEAWSRLGEWSAIYGRTI